MGHSVMLKVQFKIKVNSYELCGSNNLATILSKIYKGYKEKIKHREEETNSSWSMRDQ